MNLKLVKNSWFAIFIKSFDCIVTEVVVVVVHCTRTINNRNDTLSIN